MTEFVGYMYLFHLFNLNNHDLLKNTRCRFVRCPFLEKLYAALKNMIKCKTETKRQTKKQKIRVDVLSVYITINEFLKYLQYLH